MDRIFIAVMVSSILVLITAAGIFVRDAAIAQAPAISIVRGQH